MIKLFSETFSPVLSFYLSCLSQRAGQPLGAFWPDMVTGLSANPLYGDAVSLPSHQDVAQKKKMHLVSSLLNPSIQK